MRAYLLSALRLAALVAAGVISIGGPSMAQQTTQSSSGQTRTEHDLLGEKQVPADAYYGVQTARALENFSFRAC